jgi:hypothetical protein
MFKQVMTDLWLARISPQSSYFLSTIRIWNNLEKHVEEWNDMANMEERQAE